MFAVVVSLCAAQASISAAPAQAGWTHGDFGTLSFAPDFQSYQWVYGDSPTKFSSYPDSLGNVTGSATATGTDQSLGAYEELTLSFGVDGADGELAVRYFAHDDAFLFLRRPLTPSLPAVWPAFSMLGTNATNATMCLSWSEHFFFPGSVLPRTAHTNPQPYDLRQCAGGYAGSGGSGGGPAFFFDPEPVTGAASGPAFALSPLSHFTSQSVQNCPPGKGPAAWDACKLGVSARAGGCGAKGDRCALFNTSAVLLARPGVTRATRAFGALLRRVHGTERRRAAGVTQLSYWNDNQAGYSWWTAGDDQSIWGTPEDIYLKLKAGYDRAGIPVRGWEPDNNWNVTYDPVKNWKGREWEYNTTLYPSGGEAFVRRMSSGGESGAHGNMSFTYYTNGFTADNAYAASGKYAWTKAQEPHPNASYALYHDLLTAARDRYQMQMLFTDFLCYRGPSMQQYQDVPAGEEGGHMWLAGVADGARDAGIEVQFCMALAHQVLETAQFPAVTNARVNGDGGLDIAGATLPALLAATVGLGWSKDNLRTADRCYVNGTYPNGTVKWPCGSINKGEGTSGAFKMQVQQTHFAALSLGPVGIADQLSAHPEDPSADITSNTTLVLATCAATGDLLQPSYPLVPLDRSLQGSGPAPRLWGTYTALAADVAMVWYTAMAFCLGCSVPHGAPTVRMTVYERDLAPMVDATAVAADFSKVPLATFSDAGAAFEPVGAARVAWRADVLRQAHGGGCAGANVTAWQGSVDVDVPVGVPDGGVALLHVAPTFGARAFALLGEAGKVAAISTYRFASVELAAGGSSLEVALRGKPGEEVTLLFAVAGMAPGHDGGSATTSSYTCHAVNTTIGSDGTGAVSFLG